MINGKRKKITANCLPNLDESKTSSNKEAMGNDKENREGEEEQRIEIKKRIQ